jgi:autotransporter-associated beta strand protein
MRLEDTPVIHRDGQQGHRLGWRTLEIEEDAPIPTMLGCEVFPGHGVHVVTEPQEPLPVDRVATAGNMGSGLGGSLSVVSTNFLGADGIWTASIQGNQYLVLNYEGSRIYYWTNTTSSGNWQLTNWTLSSAAAMPSVNVSNLVLAFTNNATDNDVGYTANNDFGADLLIKRIILSNSNVNVTNTLAGYAINLVGLNPRFQQEAAGMFVVSNGVNVLSAGTLSFIGAGNGQLTMAGNIISTNGASGLVKSGSYTLVLAGNNNLGGVAAVTNGTVIVASENALRGAVVSNTVNNGLLFSNVTGATFGALAGSQNLGLTNTAGDGVGLVLSNGTASYAGILSGAGSLTKAGDNTQTLSGNSTYTGDTLVKRGTLTVEGQLRGSTNLIVTGGQFNWNNVGAMSNVTAVVVGSGGAVAFNSNGTIATLTGGGNVTVVNGSTLAVGFGGLAGTTNTFAGNITTSAGNGGTLSMIGSNWFILNGGNSVLSNVIVNSGTLLLNSGALTANSLWATGGVLRVNGGALSVGLLAGSGWISNGTDFVVGDGGSAAALNVVGGSLYVGNNVIVTNRGTLYGSGTLAASNGFGVVTIGSNAVIGAGSSGAAAGTFTINATNVVLGGGGSYLWHWASTNGPAGSAWDLVSVTGGVLSNAATTASQFTVNVGSVATNFNADLDYTNMVIAQATSLSGFSNSAYSVLATGVASVADGLWTVRTNGNTVVLDYLPFSTYTWTNTSGNWSNSAFWIEQAIPPAARSNLMVVFGGGNGHYTSTNDIAGITLKRLWLTNDADTVGTIIGSNITLVGIQSIQRDGNGMTIVSNDLTLGRNTIFGGSGTGTLTLDGQISGNYGFTKTGTWTLVLGGSNTFSGGVNLLGGVTVITNDIALGAANNLVSISNATLSVTNTSGGLRGFSANSAVFDVQTNSTYTVNGSLSGAGVISLIKSNSGTLAFAGSGGTVNGQTIVKEGTLRIGGGTWGNITNAAGTLMFDPSSSATVNGNISGQGGISMQGGGTLYLFGNNTNLDGGLVIKSGTVAVTNDLALGRTGSNVTFSGNGTLQAVASYDSSRNITINSGVTGTLSVTGGLVNTWNGTISGDGGLTKAGSGVLVLTSNNTYLGSTLVAGGTLRVNGTLEASTGAVTVNGGTLAGTGTINRAVILTNGVITAGNGGPGVLTMDGLTWNGGSTYQVAFTNWAGTAGTGWSKLAVNGQLILTNYASNRPFVIDVSGTTNGFNNQTSWLIATASGGIVAGDFSSSQFSVVQSNLTGTINGAFNVTTNGNGLYLGLTGAYTWTDDSETVQSWTNKASWMGERVAPTNNYDTAVIFRGNGTITNDQSILRVVGMIFNIAGGSNQVLSGNELTVDGFQAPTWEQINSGTMTFSNDIILAKSLAMSGSGAGTVTIAGVISGTNFTKTGNWTLNLSGANTFTGNVSIIGGALGWNNATALGYTGNVVTVSNVALVAAVNTLDNPLVFGGANAITNATGSGTLTLLGSFNGSGILMQQVTNLVLGGGGTYSGEIQLPTSGALILSNQPSVALNLNGTISGAGSVTATNVIKTGTGTVTLAGNNTYVGNTDVRGGTLVVGSSTALGTSGNPVTVGDQDNFGTAGLLFGDGVAFNREVQVVSAGVATTRVGNVSGTATLTGQLTLNDDVALFSGGRMKFTGVLTNTGPVSITTGGGGIIELAGTNKLSSGITVSSATLMVNDKTGIAAGTNLISVLSSGTLAGNGLVATSSISGAVAPGDVGVGNLTLVDSSVSSGAKYAWDLGDTKKYSGDGNINEGTNWDFLTVSNLTLAAGTYTVDINSAFFHPDGPGGTNSYRIGWAGNGGSWSNGATWAANWVGANPSYNGYGWWVTTKNQNELWLNYGAGEGFTYAMVIPEPNVLLLWLSSIATIYAARRRIRAVKQRA